MNILAVDDDPIILDLIRTTVQPLREITVTTSSSSLEAWDLLSAGAAHFDCLLLDIEMPDIDGITLCRQIRSLPDHLDTPILMLTRRTDALSVGHAFVAGATDYVTKPFDLGDLKSRLRVADRMVKRSDAVPQIPARALQKIGLPGVHSFNEDQPLHIKDVPQLIGPFSLGAYLSQLSRSSLDDCHIFAATIDTFPQIYADGSTAELGTAIVATTKIIARSLDCPQLLMAHQGCGILLCVMTTAQPPNWEAVEEAIQREITQMDLRFGHKGKIVFSLSVGKPIQPYASPTQRVKKTFDRAIARVTGPQKQSFVASEPKLRSAAFAQ